MVCDGDRFSAESIFISDVDAKNGKNYGLVKCSGGKGLVKNDNPQCLLLLYTNISAGNKRNDQRCLVIPISSCIVGLLH